MPEINDAGYTLRRTRAQQPQAKTVVGGTLCFITDERVIERSNGIIWEPYSAGALDVPTTGLYAPVLLVNAVAVPDATYGSDNKGSWVRVGAAIWFSIRLSVTNRGSVASGEVSIGGLPFSGATSYFSPVSSLFWQCPTMINVVYSSVLITTTGAVKFLKTDESPAALAQNLPVTYSIFAQGQFLLPPS